MAKKKRSIAAASAASSSSSRRPPENDSSAEGSVQALKNLNFRLAAEAAELQKEVKLLTSKLALAGSSRCNVNGRGRVGVAPSSRVGYTASVTRGNRKTAKQEASVEMGVTPVATEPKQGKQIVSKLTSTFADQRTVDGIQRDIAVLSSSAASISAGCAADLPLGNENMDIPLTPVGTEPKQSNTCCSEPVSVDIIGTESKLSSSLASTVVSAGSTLMAAPQESGADTTEQEQCRNILLPSSPAFTAAGFAAGHPLVEPDLANGMNQCLVKMAECRDEPGIEKMLEEKDAEYTDAMDIEKALTEEITSLKKRPEEKDLKSNMAAEKKSKWGVLKWIVPAGIFVGITDALYAKSK